MLSVFIGSDRAAARAALERAAAKLGKRRQRVVVTDAHTAEDLRAALRGGGMFAIERTVVLDSILGNEEMRATLLGALPELAASTDTFFLLEEKLDAATKKTIEKHATELKKFDRPAGARGGSSFAIANALRRADKKAAWVALQRELIAGAAPEAIHGILFWAAKDMALKSATERSRRLVEMLAELPHEARRRGEGLDLALEHFVLSGA